MHLLTPLIFQTCSVLVEEVLEDLGQEVQEELESTLCYPSNLLGQNYCQVVLQVDHQHQILAKVVLDRAAQ